MEDINTRLYALTLLQNELIRYRKIFSIDQENNFANKYFMTSIDCHLEDLGIEIDELKEEVASELQTI